MGGGFLSRLRRGGGDAEAIRIIDERFVARMPVRLRRLGSKPEAIADVLQTVRERLFAGAEPRIRTYDARGPLEQWIKVVAMRTAIDMHRNAEAAPRAESAWLDILSTVCPDTTTLLARAECKARLEAAIREEVATLPPREKAVLRLHVVEGVSVEKIALSYGVHRVTVARWIWTAGETLLDGLQRRFRDSLGIAPSRSSRAWRAWRAAQLSESGGAARRLSGAPRLSLNGAPTSRVTGKSPATPRKSDRSAGPELFAFLNRHSAGYVLIRSMA